jgi:tetratricopeptide (TPR) repeat protein
MGLAAGIVGAALMWFFLGRNTTVTMPLSPAPATVAADAPPSVAHLPPADAAVLLGNWHYDRQRWFQAIEQYEGALRLGKDNADVRTDLGNCYRFIKQPNKALEQYQISQRMQPEHENSLFNEAALYAQELHQIPRAKELLNEYLRRFPTSPGASRAQQLLSDFNAQEQKEADQLKKTLQQVIEK